MIWLGIIMARGELKWKVNIVKSYIKKPKVFFYIALFSLAILVIDQLLLAYGGLLGKGIAFTTKGIAFMSLFAALMTLSIYSKALFHFLFFITVLVFLLSAMFIASDVSRYSLLKLFILYIISVFAFREKALSPLSLKALFLVGIFLSIVVLIFGLELITTIGGDVLILSNAMQVMVAIDSGAKIEPFMPIYNLGLFMLPESLWFFGEKPSMFNTNTWFLINILNYDPEEYPWGVGLGGVGAAYIYGAGIGVVTLYFLVGIFFGVLIKRATNPYTLGIYFYYITALPFSLYRMDETFLFETGIITIPVTLLMLKYFTKYENRYFILGETNIKNVIINKCVYGSIRSGTSCYKQ